MMAEEDGWWRVLSVPEWTESGLDKLGRLRTLVSTLNNIVKRVWTTRKLFAIGCMIIRLKLGVRNVSL